MQPKPPLKITANAYLEQIERMCRNEWLNTWKNNLKGRKLFDIQPEQNDLSLYDGLPRKLQTFAA